LDREKNLAIKVDIDWLTSRRQQFVAVSCPACGGSSFKHHFAKFGFDFDRCGDCRTVFMNPRAPAELLGEFYKRSAVYEFWNEYVFPASRTARIEGIFKPRLARILELCQGNNVPRGMLVEIGAAAGMFCEEALRTKTFERVVGIEPNAVQAEKCRSLGIEVIEDPVERAAEFDRSADVVVCFETIEHVFDPGALIAWCGDLLSPGGLLILTCPNSEGFDILTLATQSDSIDAEHINLFNPHSLKLLVESMGLDVLECTTPGELDVEIVRNKVVAGEYSLENQAFLERVLLSEWGTLGHAFQEFLKANRLSSHMWLVARNPDVS